MLLWVVASLLTVVEGVFSEEDHKEAPSDLLPAQGRASWRATTNHPEVRELGRESDIHDLQAALFGKCFPRTQCDLTQGQIVLFLSQMKKSLKISLAGGPSTFHMGTRVKLPVYRCLALLCGSLFARDVPILLFHCQYDSKS